MAETYWLRGEPVTVISRFSDSCTIKFNDGTTALVNPIILNNSPPPIDETAEFKSIIQSLRRFLYKVAAENLASQFRFEEIVARIDRLTDLILDLGGGVGNLDVNITSALPAGENNIGDVDIASLPPLPAGENNIGDVDIASLPPLPAGENNIGDVDIASLPAAMVSGNRLMVDAIAQGILSHDNPMGSVAPIPLGANARSAYYPTVDNDDIARLICSLGGALITFPYAPPDQLISAVTPAITGTANTQLFAAAGAGTRNYLCHLVCVNTSATATAIEVKDGTLAIGRFFVPAGPTITNFPLSLPLRTSVNAVMNVACLATGTSTVITGIGFRAP